MLVASPFALIAFARYETRLSARGGDPLIAVHLLRNGAFVIGLVMALAFYMLSSFYLTFAVYLQSGLHDTDGRPLTVRATAYDICMRRIARHSPDYTGKVTVPVLRDHRSRRIVSDESLEIAQMQDDAFDEICGDRCFDLSPARLKPAMDELNTRIARSLSVAVYAVAGARNQQEYEAAMDELFDFLDDLDRQLEDGRPFLLGDRPTLADVPVYTPLVRFDVVYNSLSGRAAGD
jgi:glutathione S-transferase